ARLPDPRLTARPGDALPRPAAHVGRERHDPPEPGHGHRRCLRAAARQRGQRTSTVIVSLTLIARSRRSPFLTSTPSHRTESATRPATRQPRPTTLVSTSPSTLLPSPTIDPPAAAATARFAARYERGVPQSKNTASEPTT